VTLDHAVEFTRQALMLALLVAAPVLAVGLVVGLIVSLLQAVTQLQEQTLSFIPKIVAMAFCAVLLLPWMGQHLIEYARQMFGTGLIK
jgi:flagellar biosynthetic protein FliQ